MCSRFAALLVSVLAGCSTGTRAVTVDSQGKMRCRNGVAVASGYPNKGLRCNFRGSVGGTDDPRARTRGEDMSDGTREGALRAFCAAVAARGGNLGVILRETTPFDGVPNDSNHEEHVSRYAVEGSAYLCP